MKNLTTLLVMVLLTAWAITTTAQKKAINRSLMFSEFPAKIDCSTAQLNQLFAAGKGQQIEVTLPGNFKIAGPVTSRVNKYANLQTIVIKLPAYNNALFSLSRQINNNSTPAFVGRILNLAYGDGYELQQTANGNYQLIKIELAKILETCNQ